jgi:glycyl-radical enzyme activating protein
MNLTGKIFDIQRAGLYDGPGIRTVVFFKGCPLRCVWCHNPESQQSQPQIAFRPDHCVVCGTCVEVCEHQAHTILNGQHHYDREHCKRCGECVQQCIFEALQITGREMSVEEVFAEVESDRIYYEQSGGGLTLTGGEPMLQLNFTLALLSKARQSGIHTCIETCGFASPEAYRQVFPLVDLVLFDYKATGSQEHQRLTGVPQDLILKNLALILESGSHLWLRCPIVPGVNDTQEHFQGIAELERQFPQIEVIEILPYHNLGNDKYARYGMTNPLPGIPTAVPQIKDAWLERLRRLGCQKVAL